MRRGLTLGVLSALAFAAPASASEYTLDGRVTTQAAAEAAGNRGGGCAVTPAADGTTACFSSEAVRDAAAKADLAAGRVPAGYGSLPPSKPSARAAARRRGPVARMAACQNQSYNHVFTDANMSGAYGYFGYQSLWAAFSSTFNNTITSYRHSGNLYTYYNEYTTGSGATYYGGETPCSEAYNLATGNPRWNNEFSAFRAFNT
jgi:poly-gamma-glutamate capsule biosynthesis protein CapA/YwtB (metallophosphatase superfamily)